MTKTKLLGAALMAMLALSGCYNAAEQAAREQAAREQAVQEAKAQELTKTQIAWTQAVAGTEQIRGQLVRSEFDRAKVELGTVYTRLYSVVTGPDLTTELRTRVTRVFPTLITLQAKVDARDPEAAVLADKLADMLKETHGYMVTSGWLRGGGAGIGAPLPTPKEKAPVTLPMRAPNLP